MDFIKFVYNCTKSPPPSPTPFDCNVIFEVLDNEMLLELIFEKVETIDLKSCRLVSSKWDSLAAKQIRKNYFKTRKLLRLASDAGIEYFISTFGHNPGSILHNSLDFMLESHKLQFNPLLVKEFFTTFRHRFESLDLGFSFNNTRELGNILRLQSNTLTDLRICTRDAWNSHKLKFPAFVLTNLKSLLLSENYDEPKDEEYAIGQLHLLELLLLTIPKENTVKLCLRSWERIGETAELLKKFERVKSLKELEIFDIESGEFQQLIDAGVCLDFLNLDPSPCFQEVMTDRLYTDETRAYLCHQSESLRKLALANPVFKFPATMTGLRKLRLNYEEDEPGTNEPQSRTPILYEKCFPNLEELQLRSDSEYKQSPFSFQSQFLTTQVSCTSLKKLDIRYFQICAGTMEKVSAIFSTITSLSISHYRKFKKGAEDQRRLYSAIWNSNFADTLEELTIGLEDDEDPYVVKRRLYSLDHIFSDVPEVEISEKIASKSFMESYDRPKYNSIFKLKNLKSLKVLGTSGWKAEPFTDFSAFCIFGKMSKLNYLHLDEGIHKFSSLGLQYLRDKFVETPIEKQPKPYLLDLFLGNRETDHESKLKMTRNLLKHEPGLQEKDGDIFDTDEEFSNDFDNSDPENTYAFEVVEKKLDSFGRPKYQTFRKARVQNWDSESESELDMSDLEPHNNYDDEDISDSERSIGSIGDVEFSEPEESDTEESNELVD